MLPMPDQQVNVEWTAPDVVNGKITGYVIHYGELKDGETEPTEWKTANVSGDDVNHQLPQLEPKKTYSVKVQAVSDRGPGVISDSQIVRTLPLGKCCPFHFKCLFQHPTPSWIPSSLSTPITASRPPLPLQAIRKTPRRRSRTLLSATLPTILPPTTPTGKSSKLPTRTIPTELWSDRVCVGKWQYLDGGNRWRELQPRDEIHGSGHSPWRG